MTKREIADLLELVITAYPDTFIKDVGALLSVWEMAFAEDPADKVYRAARHHINVSRKFPTIADIKKSIGKGELIYGNQPEVKAIEAPKIDIRDKICEGSWACPYFEGEICYGTKEEQDKCIL